jgi:hypothetical protein
MTLGDIQFLKAMGIDPRSLGDPFPTSLPPPPTEAPIPKLAEEDSRWLQNLRVIWNETEHDGIPPKTLREFLTRCPTGMRQAVEAVASEMGLALPDGGLDDLAQKIKEMFIGFDEEGMEDVIAMFPFDTFFRPRPEAPISANFQTYVKFRIRACVPVALRNRMSGTDNLGESR